VRNAHVFQPTDRGGPAARVQRLRVAGAQQRQRTGRAEPPDVADLRQRPTGRGHPMAGQYPRRSAVRDDQLPHSRPDVPRLPLLGVGGSQANRALHAGQADAPRVLDHGLLRFPVDDREAQPAKKQQRERKPIRNMRAIYDLWGVPPLPAGHFRLKPMKKRPH
jgi:hypothetical protein